MEDSKSIRVTRLIAIPAVITLAVTILRLVGELKHWPAPWFNPAAGGGAAIVGISWLPLIFGPIFAIKLVGAGNAPSSQGKAIGFSLVGLVVFVAGGALSSYGFQHSPPLILVGMILMLGSGLVPRHVWPPMGNVMIAYAFAARLPVVIVMYYAMKANGGTGLGTHYDKVPPTMANLPFMTKFIEAAILPQMTLWIGWTLVLGMLFGSIVVALARRGKQTAQAGA